MSSVSSCICVATVPNDRIAFIERFGKFSRTAKSGLNPIMCCLGECLAGSLSLRVQQLDVQVETKTKDNVFLFMTVSVQYEVRAEDVYEAYYKLTNPREQITSFVFDVVRSTVPKIILDDVFDSKDEIASAVKLELSKTMPGYGFNILQTLVTDISPNNRVKEAMNEINAAQRIRQAATDKAEAEKILVVKAAEADAESKYLAGVGISRQRQAIVQGLRESVVAFTDNVTDISPQDVLELMLMTQYLDTMKEIGAQAKSTTVFVPSNPGSGLSEMRNGMMQAHAAQLGGPTQQGMSRQLGN